MHLLTNLLTLQLRSVWLEKQVTREINAELNAL